MALYTRTGADPHPATLADPSASAEAPRHPPGLHARKQTHAQRTEVMSGAYSNYARTCERSSRFQSVQQLAFSVASRRDSVAEALTAERTAIGAVRVPIPVALIDHGADAVR